MEPKLNSTPSLKELPYAASQTTSQLLIMYLQIEVANQSRCVGGIEAVKRIFPAKR